MKTVITFEFVRLDTWGNKFVHCPVCAWTHKLDGVRKHIQQKAFAGDKRHEEWLRRHPWQRGTKTPARVDMKP